MKVLKFIGLMVLSYAGIVILAIAITFITLFTYFYLQFMLFGRGNYLLFVSNEINIVPAVMIMILILYMLFLLKEKVFKKKEEITELSQEIDQIVENEQENEILIEIENDSKRDILLLKLLNTLLALDDKMMKVFKVIKTCYIPALIIVVYWGMTSYTVLYNDTIKISSPTAPAGKIYSYSDIKNVNVGVGKHKNSYTPYYKITLKNNQTVDLFGGGAMDSPNANHEEVLVNLDNALKKQGVQKTADKSNFERFAEGLDEGYVKEVEKLFQ